MNAESVELRDFSPLKEKLEKFRTSGDETVRRDAEALSRDLQDAEGNIEGVAFTLENAVRPCLAGMDTKYSRIVSRLLESVPPASDSKQHMIESVLAFSRGFEGLRLHVEECTSEPFAEEMSLDEIRVEIDARNALCVHYASLFATILRAAGEQDSWTKFLELGGDSPLMKIIEREVVPQDADEEKMLIGPVEPPPLPDDTPVGAPVGPVEPPALPDDAPVITQVDPIDPPALPEGTPKPSPATPVEPVASADATPAIAPKETAPAPIDPSKPPPSSNPGKCADVLFVIDASGSMRGCFDQLRDNIKKFVEPFREEGFDSLRLGLLAYSANINRTTKKCVYRNIVLDGEGAAVMKSLYGALPMREESFFTRSGGGGVDTDSFVHRLDGVRCKGDEDTMFALDCAGDFPFGPLETTRRVIVLFTDEKIEDGVLKAESIGENFAQVEKVMKKIVDRHVSLYVFAPASPVTDTISEFSRTFLTVVPEFRPDVTDTWAQVDFARILEMMGKSVSSSLSGGNDKNVPRAIFGQDSWTDDRWA